MPVRAGESASLQAYFEQAGVEFADENGGSPGVQLRKTGS